MKDGNSDCGCGPKRELEDNFSNEPSYTMSGEGLDEIRRFVAEQLSRAVLTGQNSLAPDNGLALNAASLSAGRSLPQAGRRLADVRAPGPDGAMLAPW